MAGTTLTPNQIASLAYQAGFRGSALTMATAIALAESSGNVNAYNPETAAGTPPGRGSYGLWQIYRNAHPEFNSTNLYDPAANARAAFSVYRAAGNKFTPWSTYTNGSANNYAKQLQGLKVSGTGTPPSAGNVQVTGGPAPITQAVAGSSQPPSLIPSVTVNVLPKNISDALAAPDLKVRLVVGAIGFIVLIFGLLMLVGTFNGQPNPSGGTK